MIKQGFSKFNGFHFITLSPMTGEPVLNIVQTRTSSNSKTGKTVQTWHLMPDIAPLEARRYGAGDESICGKCPHRAKPDEKAGSCYVYGFVIKAIYEAYQRGRYPSWEVFGDTLTEVLAKAGEDKTVRLGAYGDPVCMGPEAIAALCSEAKGWLGYTHQWRDSNLAWAKAWMMASADNPKDLTDSIADGWRAFAVYSPDVEPADALAIARKSGAKVVKCPASNEAGNKTSCNACPIKCSGTGSGIGHSVMIQAHGAGSVLSRYRSSDNNEQWKG